MVVDNNRLEARLINRPTDQPPITIINQFFYPDVDADAQFAYDIAKGLVEKGYRVQVVCQRGLKNVDSAEKLLKKKESVKGIEIHRLPDAFSNRNLLQKFLRHSLFYLALLVKLSTSTSRQNSLLVISNPPYSGFITTIMKAFKHYRYFFAVKDVYPDAMVSYDIIEKDGFIYRLLDWAIKISYRHADKILSLGPYMTKRIKDKGIDEDKILEIPNWGFEGLYSLERKDNPFIGKMGLKDKFVVLYSGNHGLGHKFDTVLEGAKQLSRDFDDVYFVFIGGGKRFNEVKAFSDENPDAHILTFDYLPMEQLNYGLNLADVSLITMRDNWEGVIVPSKIYGIMAVGSPIVYVGPDSDTSWTIEKHNCGFVVRSGSVDEFVEKIKELYYNEELRKEMASNARKGFEKEYTKEKGIERYLSVLAP